MLSEFATYTRGEIFSVLGILISLVGFVFALLQLRKTRTSAESAKNAAIAAQKDIQRIDGLLEVASVTEAIIGIKRSIRSEDWAQIPPLIEPIRKTLISVQSRGTQLEQEELGKIQDALIFFENMEIELETNDHEKLSVKRPDWLRNLIQISAAMAKMMNDQKNLEGSK